MIEDRLSYHLSDLLRYHDRAFVVNAYSAIAKSPPDSIQLNETLHELRGGLRTKTEIVEELVAKYPSVRVDGLSSPAMRRLNRLPLIGAGLRTLRAIIRLPVLLQHEQQFESYMTGQHQQITDHVNDVNVRHAELQENVSDAIKTVMMLSDSLIELSAQVANGEDRLQTLQLEREKAEADLRKHMLELTEQLMTSAQELQRQQETSESRLHADLVALTDQVSALQQALTDARTAQDLTASAQREFLIDEQRAIVEAQRAAITDLQDQLDRINKIDKI